MGDGELMEELRCEKYGVGVWEYGKGEEEVAECVMSVGSPRATLQTRLP